MASVSAGTCKVCREPISGSHVSTQAHKYHKECFVCHQCLEPFKDNIFFEADGGYYCESDHSILHGENCGKSLVGSTFVRKDDKPYCKIAIGKIYHPEHFVCWKCEKPFDGAPYFEYQSRPYCEAHYKELTGSVCQYCRSAAKGNVVSALGVRWCEQHFMCMGCFCALADGKAKFMEWDNKPFCKRCYEKLPGDVRRSLSKYKEYEKKFTPVFADGPR
nr:hypothetical protein HK105_007162 [Polyrhizophydium stewartii]